MSRWKGFRARLRSLRRGAAEARMEEEFEFHVAMETELNVRRGMRPDEARRRAEQAFGGRDRHREELRDGRALGWVSDLRQDLQFAWRGFGRTPVFAVVGIVTIALGVGATTALFSLANAVLLRQLPIPDAERVVSVNEYRSGMTSNGVEGERIPWPRYLAYREAARDVFTKLAAHRSASVSLRATGDARPAPTMLISAEYFDVLGLAPLLGRYPAADDEPVVVLSHATWQARYAGAADVIGSTVWVDGRPFTVSGVAPERFVGTAFGTRPELWIPIEAYAAGQPASFEQWVTPFGRLLPGVSEAAARTAMEAAAHRIENPAGTTVRRVELAQLGTITGEARTIAVAFMAMLVGTALLVLLIAAANVAGMLLARALARQREVAVRLALGAGRGRLVRQLLAESLLLFLLGGGVGVLLAFGLNDLLARVQAPGPGMAFHIGASIDLRVLLFALLISVVPALLFGLVPALQSTRPDLVPALRESARGGGVRSVRLRSVFVAGQLAMAVLLLVTAGLFVRSLRHGLRVDPGFLAEGVVVAGVSLTPLGYDESRGRAFFNELVERVGRQPGVESVALARRVLLAGESYGTTMRTADAPAGDRGIQVRTNVVDTGYVATLRMRLLAGRGFEAGDRPGAPDVIVINQALARAAFPETDPVGRVLREGDRERLVIGVLPDGKYVDIGEEPRPFAFVPYSQNYSGTMVLHVRGAAPAAETLGQIRSAVRAIDPNVALTFAERLETMTAITLFPQRFAATLVGILGALGMLLAGIGVYGVLMYHLAQRSHELGVRIALGARTAEIATGVLVRSLRISLAGVAVGVVAAWFVARLLSGFILGVSVRDPVTFVVVPILLGALAIAAAGYPAFRACRVDPMVVLRAD